MTQNNLYMEGDEMRLYVDVQPLFIDELENSKNAAALSAAQAAQSEAAASNWKNEIEDYKTNMELFYAQASDDLSDLYDDSVSELTSAKNTALEDLQTQKNLILNNITSAEQSAETSIEALGQNYVNQARGYAEQAQNTVDNRVSLEHLNQSKGLETGGISDDNDVLPWVKHLIHSTFDVNKFTTQGSPVITTDGIASGISTSNNLTTTIVELDYSKDFDFISPVATLASNSSQKFFILDGNGGFRISQHVAQVKFSFKLNTDTTLTDYNVLSGLAVGDKIQGRIKKVGTNLYLYARKNDGDWVGYANNPIANVTTLNANNVINIGWAGAGDTYCWDGSLNLRYMSITVDGVPVFSGNKTGIDTIKASNFTVTTSSSSSPFVNPSLPFSDSGFTITADGFAVKTGSGIVTKSLNISQNSKLKIEARILTPKGINASGATDGFLIQGLNNNVLQLYFFLGYYGFTANMSGTGSGNVFERAVTPETWYDTILEYNGADGYTFSAKKESDTNWTSVSKTNVNFTGIDEIRLCATINNNTGGYSIDLNAFKVYIDGDLVYQPCLTIPYTEAKTGSKIADSVYRDRVDDMYQQFGYAPYYTLSGSDFSLPKGEIYGMIENLRKLIIQRTT